MTWDKKKGNIIYWFFILVLSTAIITWLISSLKELERKETNIDRLSSGLYIVRMLLPESAEIALLTNMDGSHETELLAQAQFILAPRLVLTDQPAAYILLIEDPTLPGKKPVNASLICSVHKDHLVYTLLKRKN